MIPFYIATDVVQDAYWFQADVRPCYRHGQRIDCAVTAFLEYEGLPAGVSAQAAGFPTVISWRVQVYRNRYRKLVMRELE